MFEWIAGLIPALPLAAALWIGVAILFGWAMASLQGGDTARARQIADDMGKRFPDSAYTGRLKQNLAAVK